METLKAKDYNEAYDMCENENRVFARVQWKGTDVCLDFDCECGESWHIDGFFAYSVKCKECGSVYYLNPNIQMVKLETEPDINKHCESLIGM